MLWSWPARRRPDETDGGGGSGRPDHERDSNDMTRIRVLLFLAAAAALLLTADSGLAAFIRCQTGVVCTGTEQADDLVGTSRNNVVNGLGGDDILTLATGDDEGYGGPGNDKVFGE